MNTQNTESDMNTQDPTELFDFADQLALISTAVFRLRIEKDAELTDEQKRKLNTLQDDLDKATADMLANGIAALGASIATEQAEIEAAAKKAAIFLRKIKEVERTLDVATSILGLAVAVIAGNPGGIISALADVKDKVTDAEA